MHYEIYFKHKDIYVCTLKSYNMFFKTKIILQLYKAFANTKKGPSCPEISVGRAYPNPLFHFVLDRPFKGINPNFIYDPIVPFLSPPDHFLACQIILILALGFS
jgi:hypothetical protein